jgi:PAS domain-containing protein
VEPAAPAPSAADLPGAAVEHAPIGVVAVDHDGRVLVRNAAAHRLTGRSAEEVPGRRPQGLPLDAATSARLAEVATRPAVTRSTTLVHGRVRTRPGGGARFDRCPAGHPPPVPATPGPGAAFLDGPVERRRDPDDRAGADLLDLVRTTRADTQDDTVVLAVRVAAA